MSTGTPRGARADAPRISVDEIPDLDVGDPRGSADVEPYLSLRVRRGARLAARPELAGAVHIRHDGREYAGWYRVIDDLLTVYCGLASNTGLLPRSSPSPKPLAERLLRDLVEAEHPGLEPG